MISAMFPSDSGTSEIVTDSTIPVRADSQDEAQPHGQGRDPIGVQRRHRGESRPVTASAAVLALTLRPCLPLQRLMGQPTATCLPSSTLKPPLHDHGTTTLGLNTLGLTTLGLVPPGLAAPTRTIRHSMIAMRGQTARSAMKSPISSESWHGFSTTRSRSWVNGELESTDS